MFRRDNRSLGITSFAVRLERDAAISARRSARVALAAARKSIRAWLDRILTRARKRIKRNFFISSVLRARAPLNPTPAGAFRYRPDGAKGRKSRQRQRQSRIIPIDPAAISVARQRDRRIIDPMADRRRTFIARREIALGAVN